MMINFAYILLKTSDLLRQAFKLRMHGLALLRGHLKAASTCYQMYLQTQVRGQ